MEVDLKEEDKDGAMKIEARVEHPSAAASYGHSDMEVSGGGMELVDTEMLVADDGNPVGTPAEAEAPANGDGSMMVVDDPQPECASHRTSAMGWRKAKPVRVRYGVNLQWDKEANEGDNYPAMAYPKELNLATRLASLSLHVHSYFVHGMVGTSVDMVMS